MEEHRKSKGQDYNYSVLQGFSAPHVYVTHLAVVGHLQHCRFRVVINLVLGLFYGNK